MLTQLYYANITENTYAFQVLYFIDILKNCIEQFIQANARWLLSYILVYPPIYVNVILHQKAFGVHQLQINGVVVNYVVFVVVVTVFS